MTAEHGNLCKNDCIHMVSRLFASWTLTCFFSFSSTHFQMNVTFKNSRASTTHKTKPVLVFFFSLSTFIYCCCLSRWLSKKQILVLTHQNDKSSSRTMYFFFIQTDATIYHAYDAKIKYTNTRVNAAQHTKRYHQIPHIVHVIHIGIHLITQKTLIRFFFF